CEWKERNKGRDPCNLVSALLYIWWQRWDPNGYKEESSREGAEGGGSRGRGSFTSWATRGPAVRSSRRGPGSPGGSHGGPH
ncbi:unnamed protein product, partial [Lampetra planeri]